MMSPPDFMLIPCYINFRARYKLKPLPAALVNPAHDTDLVRIVIQSLVYLRGR
jgi:hypothetical protein